MKALSYIAMILIIIGALNWGLWGFLQFDFVAWVFGGNTAGWSRFVYAIIGLAGLWKIVFCSKCACSCHKK